VRYALLQKPALVTVAKDGIVEVQLDSNPTTGYTWTLAAGSKGLEQMGSKYVAKSADGMVGGGGIQTYTFKATGDGENDLEFVYKVRETQPLASSQIRLLIFIILHARHFARHAHVLIRLISRIYACMCGERQIILCLCMHTSVRVSLPCADSFDDYLNVSALLHGTRTLHLGCATAFLGKGRCQSRTS
jgi:predicted secreted protein